MLFSSECLRSSSSSANYIVKHIIFLVVNMKMAPSCSEGCQLFGDSCMATITCSWFFFLLTMSYRSVYLELIYLPFIYSRLLWSSPRFHSQLSTVPVSLTSTITQGNMWGTLPHSSLTFDPTVFSNVVTIVRMLVIYWGSLEEVLSIGPSLHMSFSCLAISPGLHSDNEVSS